MIVGDLKVQWRHDIAFASTSCIIENTKTGDVMATATSRVYWPDAFSYDIGRKLTLAKCLNQLYPTSGVGVTGDIRMNHKDARWTYWENYRKMKPGGRWPKVYSPSHVKSLQSIQSESDDLEYGKTIVFDIECDLIGEKRNV